MKPLTVCTICARGGSTGLPGKNIKELLGKPLIAHTIEQALLNPNIDRVFVSTDSEEIASIASEWGAEIPFLRDASMATSEYPKLPVIENLVEWVDLNVGNVGRIIDLDPTSPLRDQSDISKSLLLLDNNTDAVITGYISTKNPYFNMLEIDGRGYAKLVKHTASDVTSRQSAPIVYSMNASIYCWHRHTLSRGLWSGCTKLHIMPRERSIDIDEQIDFEFVELLMKKKSAS